MRFSRGAILGAAVLAFFLLAIGGGVAAGFLSELLWYRSVQMEGVFWTYWRASLVVRGAAATVIMGVVFANLWVVTRSLGAIRVRRRYGNIEIAERLPQSYLLAALTAISLFSAWWLSGGVADPLPILASLNPTDFGVRDSAFGFDAAFYVFQLPVLSRLQTLASLVVFWIGLLSVAAYAITGAIKVVDGKPVVSRVARRHLGMLVAAFLLFYAVNVWLGRYGLVVDGNGFGGVLGYTDIHARLPAKLVVIALVLMTAGSVAYGAWVGNLRLALVTAVLLPIGIVGAEGIYPSAVQRFVVEPNEFPRERPFIEQQIAFTRTAFGLQDIEPVAMPFRASADYDEAELVERLQGIPLWDPRPLLTTYQAQQALFRYYTFTSVHHDRYLNDGRLEPVAVSVRELETSELEPAAQTWQNLHLNYVAGAGAVASPVARMATNGTPIFYVWDLDPPKLSADAPPELSLDDPRIYFGERSSEYIIIGPEHEPAGIPLNAWWRKLLFAWSFRSNNILLSGDLTPESKIVYRRRVTERVEAVAPFLHIPRDRSAFPVVSDGRIVWVVDAYTTSADFPLSRLVAFETRGVRYLRNSVKATVDAVTGEIRLYAMDTDDPILSTYSAIFPGLVRPLSEMPEALRSHLRFPVQMMTIQAQVLGAYHLLDPRQFYEQQDVWSIATEQFRGTPMLMEPVYSIFPLPGLDSEEFLLSVPFVARGRQNMTALMVARNDPPNYGRQILYLMPRDEQVPGPQQIEAAIDQNPEISQQLALWLRGGSAVLRGHLMIVPIDGTLLYVEPLFLEAENAAIPQLERVILAQGGRVVMEPTFESAVAALLRGPGAGSNIRRATPEGATDAGPTPGLESLTQAQRLLDEAEARLRAGDWAGFGQALQSLREALAIPAGGF